MITKTITPWKHVSAHAKNSTHYYPIVDNVQNAYIIVFHEILRSLQKKSTLVSAINAPGIALKMG
jgi:hypothetical protein